MEVIVKDDDRRQLLKAHNDLRNMISTIHECHDIWMSDVGKLEHLCFLLHHALEVHPACLATRCGIVTMCTKKRCRVMTSTLSTGDGQRKEAAVQHPRRKHPSHEHANPCVDVVYRVLVVGGIDCRVRH